MKCKPRQGSKQLTTVQKALVKPSGTILICGPAGSGKTTTMYAMISAIDRFERNVITVEDPIEAVLSETSQIEVNPKADIAIAFTTTPLAKRGAARPLGFDAESEKANIACVARCCDVIHALTGGNSIDQSTATAIKQLLGRAEAIEPERADEPSDPNAPVMPQADQVQGRNIPHRAGWAFGPNGFT